MHAYEIPGKRYTFETGADLSAKRYHGVKLNASGQAVAAAAGEAIIGVLQTPEEANRPVQVMVDGITFAILGGTVAPNDEVEMDAEGRFIKATSGKIAGTALVGGAINEIGSVLLK